MSACLLDIFMMDAGPGLRGKIAHAEVDVSSVFTNPRSDGRYRGAGDDDATSPPATGSALVHVVAALFVVLCRRFDPIVVGPSSPDGPSSEVGSQPEISDGEASPFSPTTRGPYTLEKAFAACEAHCSSWVPRFHPHEMLEADMQACWREFDCLASVLESRQVSVELVPEDDSLARMCVMVRRPVALRKPIAEANTSDSARRPGLANLDASRGDIEPSVESEPLVLTVVDSAHRLIWLPKKAVDGATAGKAGTSKPAGSGVAESSVISATTRVRAALVQHCASLRDRFERISQASGDETPSRAFEGRVNVDRVPAPSEPSEYPSAGPAKRSGFASFSHARACQGLSACCLECPDPASSSKPPPHMTAEGPNAESSVNPVESVMTYRPIGSPAHRDSDTQDSCEKNAAGAVGADAESGADSRGVVQAASKEGGVLHSSGAVEARQPGQCERSGQWLAAGIQGAGDVGEASRGGRPQGRYPGRLSPVTNVVTAVPLPQIACLSALCRTCADISRGLRTRIRDLEEQVAKGAARSAQRRAYAASLNVAPTLLCFLGSSMGAVEAFVHEWDIRHRSRRHGYGEVWRRSGRPAMDGRPRSGSRGHPTQTASDFTGERVGDNDEALAPSGDLAHSDGGNRSEGVLPVLVVGMSSCTQQPRPSPTPGMVASSEEGEQPSTVPTAASSDSETPAPKASAPRGPLRQQRRGQRERTAPPPAVRDGDGGAESLAFVRRLLAVNGSLSLCALLTAGSAPGEGGPAGDSCRAQVVGERSSPPSTDRGSNGPTKGRTLGGRKGYVQALSELASFLESGMAARGFFGAIEKDM